MNMKNQQSCGPQRQTAHALIGSKTMTSFQFSLFSFHSSLFALAIVFSSFSRAELPLAVPIAVEPFHGELVEVDARWNLTFRADGHERAMPAADLVSWGQCPEQGRAGGLVLQNGSWLTAQVIAVDKDLITADSEIFGTVKFPREAIRGLILRPSSNPTDRDRLFDRISPLSQAGEGQGVTAAEQSDLLLLDNGDELSGHLLSIAESVAKFETDVGPIDVKTSRITAIVFSQAQKRKQTPLADQLRAWVGFTDGSRLLATRMTLENNTLNLTVSDQPLAVSQSAPRSSLVFLQPLGGSAVYLSDLVPTEYRQTPYLDLAWPFHRDRNVTGGFLCSGGQMYPKGLGVHSAARLVYNLGAGQGARAEDAPNRFAADLAIDDSTNGGGSVVFRVLVDGQEKYVSPTIHGGDPPTPVSVDIRGAKKLELIVDYADRADVLDHADWLNARLIK
jgi:hypothetical protein